MAMEAAATGAPDATATTIGADDLLIVLGNTFTNDIINDNLCE